MTDSSTISEQQHRVVRAALLTMVGTFAVLALVIHATGISWPAATGIAALPTVFGGWFFGAVVSLSRLDWSSGEERSRPPHAEAA